MNKITACIISKNEENNIYKCLESIFSFVDEIILLDTGSSDRTMEIAEKYCKVFSTKWENNFSLARNECISYAENNWIFCIDCDEIVDKETQEYILSLKKAGKINDYDVYEFRIVNHIKEKIISKSYLAKLFKNNINIKYKNNYGEFINFDNLKVLRGDKLLITHEKISSEDIKIKCSYYISKINEVIDKNNNNDKESLIGYYMELGDYNCILEKYDLGNIYYLKALKLNSSQKDILNRLFLNFAFNIKDIEKALSYLPKDNLSEKHIIPSYINDIQSKKLFIFEKYAHYKFIEDKKFYQVIDFYEFIVEYFYNKSKSSSYELKSYFIGLLLDLGRLHILTKNINKGKNLSPRHTQL